MSRTRAGLVWVVPGALVAALALAFWWAYRPAPVRLQGQIEAQSYSVASKVPGRIETVAVKKGQSLNKGALAFTIVSPELEAKLQQAQAGEAAAGALSQEAEQGARAQQIAAAITKSPHGTVMPEQSGGNIFRALQADEHHCLLRNRGHRCFRK